MGVRAAPAIMGQVRQVIVRSSYSVSVSEVRGWGGEVFLIFEISD